MPTVSTAAAATAFVAATLIAEVTSADTTNSALTSPGNLTTLAASHVDNNATTTMSVMTVSGDYNVTSCVFNPATNATECGGNLTTASTPTPLPHSMLVTVILGLLAGLVSLMTILGNITVLLAFGLERTIRQPTNYFLASLAVSDLLIGTFSMPLYTQYLLWGAWPLGPWLCDLWLSLDWTVCLTSQYTVFLITVDRFLSVKIPARYRNWRTEPKVLIMISITWILSALVFFTSIIGWQYFVGKRTVGETECEVQFMGDAMFIFLLTIGYFWITLFVIGILYAGIYKVALDLQRKSDAKHKKLQTTIELAADGPNSQTATGCNTGEGVGGRGDGGTPLAAINNNNRVGEEAAMMLPSQNNKNSGRAAKGGGATSNNRKSVRTALPCPAGAQVNTTSFTTKGGGVGVGVGGDKDEDRSSSPAFASDDDNSSSGGAVGAPSKPAPVLSSGVYIGRPNPAAGIVNSALFANTGGLVRSLHGDLFFGPIDGQEKQNLIQPPPPYSQVFGASKSSSFNDTGSDAEEGGGGGGTTSPSCPAPNDGDDTAYSSASDRLLMDNNKQQTTPLLLNEEIAKGCRFIDKRSLMETLSSENSSLLPVISQHASEVEDSDDQLAETQASSPIWKRRNSLPPSLGKEDYDYDDEISDFITGDYNTMTTTLNSGVFSHRLNDDDDDDDDDDDGAGGQVDETTPAIRRHKLPAGGESDDGLDGKTTASGDRRSPRQSNSISGGQDTVVGNHQTSPSGVSNATSNTATAYCNNNNNNANAGPTSDTNEDSSRSDIHCLSATRRRRNQDTRLHTLVKSVRSRNSRKRNRRERKSKSENRARKALRTISIILGAFVLCWTPYHIVVMVMALCKDCVPAPVYAFTYWVCYLNSPINPFCYAFANAQFKRTFIRIIRLDWHRT